MNELLYTPERKLWYDGPNYTADAVILDLEAGKILLIERNDTGEWALPGGFIERGGESSLEAAKREAEEEAGVTNLEGGNLIYRGKTTDRRSNAAAWIETSAHLFHLSSETDTTAGDDAGASKWHDLADLPPLYGAHQMLLERALDHIDGETLFSTVDSPNSRHPVEGGYMQYDKWIAEKDEESAFVKASPEKSPRHGELLLYIEKEAAVMAHLRLNGFKHSPKRSVLRDSKLVMDALSPEGGWRWQASQDIVDTYTTDVLNAFAELETVPLPTDVFAVEDSYQSILRDGWESFDGAAYAALEAKAAIFLPALDEKMQESTLKLLQAIPALCQKAVLTPPPEKLVFCHHDIRQSNLAWHPEKGVEIIDWAWAGPGLPGSDSTALLIDLHRNGYDISKYHSFINAEHCNNMIGFWLQRSILPENRAEGLRLQQFSAAVSAYEVLCDSQLT